MTNEKRKLNVSIVVVLTVVLLNSFLVRTAIVPSYIIVLLI